MLRKKCKPEIRGGGSKSAVTPVPLHAKSETQSFNLSPSRIPDLYNIPSTACPQDCLTAPATK